VEASENADGSCGAAGLPSCREFLSPRKHLAFLAALAVVGLTAIGAYAHWTSGGTGAGSGTSGNTAGIVVDQDSASTGLYPGGSVALSGDIDNLANGLPVYIASVTAVVDTFSEQLDASKPVCTQADFSITGRAIVAAQIPVGADQGSWSGLALNMIDSSSNQDNCKGISVPLTFTASP